MIKVDFRNAKVGDIVLDLVMGWVEITNITSPDTYPIHTESNSFTVGGRLGRTNPHPCLIPLQQVSEALYEMYGEPPYQFRKGDMVLVREHNESVTRRRYFSHTKDDECYCFRDGCDEWSSKGAVVSWDVCVPWVEE